MSVYVQTNLPILLPDAAANINATDTGKVLIIPNLNADRTYTLPAVAAGLHYKFIKTGAAGNIGTVAGPGAGLIKGVVLLGNGNVDVADGNDVSITFTANSLEGDSIDVA